MKKYILIVIVLALFGFVGLTSVNATQQEKTNLCHKTHSETNPWVVQSVNANEVQSHLDNGDFLYEGQFGIHTQQAKNWCADHQPEVTPTPTPTVTECEEDCEDVTPTPTPTDTPKDYCDTLEGVQAEDEDCPEVTPTPTEEPTVTPEPDHSAPATGSVCTTGVVTSLPANVFVVRNGTSATVNGFITEGDSANIYWKESGMGNWTYSSSQTNPDGVKPNGDKFVSYTINDLKEGVDYDFGFQQKTGCGTGELVTAFIHDADDYAVVFRVSKYTLN